MSTPNKVRGGQPSELTKLKLLTPEKQEVIWSWRDELENEKPLTNAQIRNRIAKQYGIRLSLDKQLSEFWRWYAAQQELEESNDLIEQFEEFTRKQNPDWSPDKVRDIGIAFFMAHTTARKDANKFATIVSLDQQERFGRTKGAHKERQVALAEQKHVETKKDDGAKALEYCLEEAKQFPAVQELFKVAFAALRKAKAK
jgi:hypothetical protein